MKSSSHVFTSTASQVNTYLCDYYYYYYTYFNYLFPQYDCKFFVFLENDIPRIQAPSLC